MSDWSWHCVLDTFDRMLSPEMYLSMIESIGLYTRANPDDEQLLDPTCLYKSE
jgi:hypothetical protein